MALRKSINLVGQATLSTEFGKVEIGQDTMSINAYIRVESVTGTKENVSASVSFTDGSIQGRKEYTFAPSMDADNFIKQAYLHLKTLDEFAGAEDV